MPLSSGAGEAGTKDREGLAYEVASGPGQGYGQPWSGPGLTAATRFYKARKKNCDRQGPRPMTSPDLAPIPSPA